MREPRFKDYSGIESSEYRSSLDNLNRSKLSRDMRDGLRLTPSGYEKFVPESGLCHREDASYCWVRDNANRLIRVRITATIEQE